jgi:hypothetical protein
MAGFCVCIGLCLTAELFRLAAGYLEKPQVTNGLCSWLGPDCVRVPALRRRSVGPPPFMAGGGSRGIPAARPTTRRLRLACTQVAICGDWAGVEEKARSRSKSRNKQML